MKIWIVTKRYGVDMDDPVVFKTQEEAEKHAKEYILDEIRECYEGEVSDPTPADLIAWAKDEDYFVEDYFFCGEGDAVESKVTCITL